MCLLKMTVVRTEEHEVRITKRSVDAQKTSEKAVFIWDDILSGFGVKCLPSGRKTYLVQYRIGGRAGRTRRVSLGVHGNVTAEIARTEAKKLLGQVAIGIDPLAKRDELKGAQTVIKIMQIFMTNHVCVKLAVNTQVNYESIIRLHIPANFKKMLIGDVTRQDVARLHHHMRESKSMANKTLAVLSKFFNWCEKYGYRADHTNPYRHVEKFKETPRQRYLSPEEQKRLGEALNKAEREGLATVYAIDALRLISLKGLGCARFCICNGSL